MASFITLSPDYYVRNDLNGSFLIRKEKGTITTSGPSIISIPSFLGYIFARIGSMEYPSIIKELSSQMNISENSLTYFTSQLVDSKGMRNFKINDNIWVNFPPHILISSQYPDNRFFYEEQGFDLKKAFNPLARPTMPVVVNLMTTTRCSTDCMYCYANRNLKNTLSCDEIVQILENLHKGGTLNIALTGGDFFMFPQWKIILETIQNLNYFQFLSTKTPIDNKDIDWLISNGYKEIQFSLDSADENVLSKMLNIDGSRYLEKVTNFLKYCSDHKFNIQIRTVVNKINENHIFDLYSFLTDFACIKKWDITPAFYSEYKKSQTTSEAPNNKNLIKIHQFIKNNSLKFPVSLNKIKEDGYCLKKYKSTNEFVENNMKCLANYTTLSILANGQCSVCEMLYDNQDYLLGDIRKFSIYEIWNSPRALNLYSPRQENFKEESPCKNCIDFSECRQSPLKSICFSNIHRTGGSPDDPDPSCPMGINCELIL